MECIDIVHQIIDQIQNLQVLEILTINENFIKFKWSKDDAHQLAFIWHHYSYLPKELSDLLIEETIADFMINHANEEKDLPF